MLPADGTPAQASRLTRPDDALRAAAEDLRRAEPAEPTSPRRFATPCTPTSPTAWETTVQSTAAQCLVGRGRCLSGYAHCMISLCGSVASRAVRVGSPARRGRNHAGSRCCCPPARLRPRVRAAARSHPWTSRACATSPWPSGATMATGRRPPARSRLPTAASCTHTSAPPSRTSIPASATARALSPRAGCRATISWSSCAAAQLRRLVGAYR